ncbi:hypothetical protein BGX38DRAFT_1144345 [Terfezia claveryi]|nr:hypothetical protein BGX38DRAFT_1144345 [Terfezia claveryi]
MALQKNIIQEMFSTVVGHEHDAQGNIASTLTYRFATHPNPNLSLAIWSMDPDLSPGNAFTKLSLPLRTATASSIVGPNRAIVRFMPNEIAFGNPRWGEWLRKSVLSKVRRDLGLDTREGPGGETLIELNEFLIIGDGGTVAAALRPPSRQAGIAYMLVLLPSWFSGGDFVFTHPGRIAMESRTSRASRSSYQILSWFTDTSLATTPIIKGNFCGLVYMIQHKESGPLSIPDVLPSAALLGTMTCFEARFRQVLRRWKQQLNQVTAIADVAEVHSSSSPKMSVKLAFLNDTTFKGEEFFGMLSDRALEVNFGSLYATLRFEESRHARPAASQRPQSGRYQTWQLHLENAFSQPLSGLLQVTAESYLLTPMQKIAGPVQELYSGLKNHGWAIDLHWEVIGNTKDRKSNPLLKIVYDWDSVDFDSGIGPVILGYSVPVLVLFPLFHLDLVSQDAGL